jgi:hypothetical protein
MKIFQRVLHAAAVVAFGAGLYALILIISLLVYLRYVYQAMFVGLEKAQELSVWVLYLAWGKWVLAAILLGLGIYAVVKKLSLKILLPGLLSVIGGLLYLRWDGEAPGQPDLGPRVTEADEGYRIVMWMSEASPYSRLGEGGVLADSMMKVLGLPSETKDWAGHIQIYRDEIMLAWGQDKLGREWIDAINARPPAGVWPQDFNAPTVKFSPIRLSTYARTGRAYALALDGRRDEALNSLVPMILAWQQVQRTGPCLLNGMIAEVVLKQNYLVVGEVLKLGNISATTRQNLTEVLQRAPAMQQVFQNAFLGDYANLAGAIEVGLQMAYQGQQQKQAEQNWMHWLVPNVIASANQTKRELMRSLQRVCELAVTRDTKRLKEIAEAKASVWSLKNPAGTIMVNMATPAYVKVVGQMWIIEDLRLALLAQLEKS